MANNDKNNTINNKENNELFDIENLLQKKMQFDNQIKEIKEFIKK